jgi:hypothetical protein
MKRSVLILGMLILCGSFLAQNRPQLDLPQETGIDRIAKTLVAALDRVDILALTDTHQRKIDSDLRLAVLRSPEFNKKVRVIVVEFANTIDQPILDRYINGEDVPLAELQKVWRNTCCPGTWDSPVYLDFFRAVRDLNKKSSADRRIRVLGGDPAAGTPSTQRMASAIAVLKNEGLDKSGKAMIIYGGHVNYGSEITTAIQQWRPGRTLVVQALGGTEADYQPFDRALKSPLRPILISGTKPPFDNFDSAFLISNKIMVNGVAISVPPQTPGTLSQLADAFVYFGGTAEADTFIRPAR